MELIFSNPKSRPPAHLECWNLRLQAYDFELMHTKGSDNPSDYLSRHTNFVSSDKLDKMAEEYVNFVTSFAVPKAVILEQIQQATV